MGKVDIATKQYMSHRDVIADAFNFYIYDGRQIIKPEKLQKIDTAEIFLPYGNDADIAVQKMRDNLMLWSMAMDNEAVYVVLGIENQDKIHYAMAVKNMLYDALQYAKQVEEAKRSYRDKTKEKTVKLNSEEFLSGFKKEDKLMPVITLVIYFGDKDWDGAKSIHDKYIIPPYTTDFAIMFLPFEGLYAEVVNMGLVEDLQKNYKVNIAGPSTMAAMLNSLQMGFRTLAIQKKSGEVWKILESAKKEFETFEDVLNKTRSRLRQADEELEKLIGVRTRAINRKLTNVTVLDEPQELD